MRHIVLPGDVGFPFSQAVLDGDLLYVAGQLAADDAGWAGPATIEAETETAMSRIVRLPARTCVGVASLLENALIEIDCVARVRSGAGS
ncbi:MAG: Endoribonuclease [Ilumatobacteraceae bacterium]|nr:Endoribonuclease [Ilumatobacteraceae bacterium]